MPACSAGYSWTTPACRHCRDRLGSVAALVKALHVQARVWSLWRVFDKINKARRVCPSLLAGSEQQSRDRQQEAQDDRGERYGTDVSGSDFLIGHIDYPVGRRRG